MTHDALGDRLGLYSGTLSFTATDVSLPGNNVLPVAAARKFIVISRKEHVLYGSPFTDCDLDMRPPIYLGKVFSGKPWPGDFATAEK
jgi:hypothetical protein